MSDQEARFDSDRLERASLRLGVVDDAAAERPRIGDDDADLHAPRLPAPREQPTHCGARDQKLRVGGDADAVPAGAAVEELLSARPDPGQDVLEVRHRRRRAADDSGIEWPSPSGEQAEREEAAADLEAPIGNVLVGHPVAGEVDGGPDQQRERA
jgi:hypothetical protein